jgi:hypothetical protein
MTLFSRHIIGSSVASGRPVSATVTTQAEPTLATIARISASSGTTLNGGGYLS